MSNPESCPKGSSAPAPEKRYRANPDFLLREIAGEAILMPTGSSMSGQMLLLNETGAFIWRQLQAAATVQDVLCAVSEAYDGNADSLEAGIRNFITEHLQSGLILEEE